MITICKLFNISLVKNGTHLHQGAKVLLPACLLSAVCFAVVNSTKDLAALKMPLSILHCQKNYLSCSKQTHHQKAQTLTVCIAGITSLLVPILTGARHLSCISLLHLQPVMGYTSVGQKSALHTKKTDEQKYLRVRVRWFCTVWMQFVQQVQPPLHQRDSGVVPALQMSRSQLWQEHQRPKNQIRRLGCANRVNIAPVPDTCFPVLNLYLICIL